jgi:hypothetical protein
MPFSQIDDVLLFDGQKVMGKGTLRRANGANEKMKTFWVRVCQTEHGTEHGHAETEHAHRTGASVNLAEGTVNGDSPSVFKADGTWELNLPMVQGGFEEGDAAVTAALVFEADGDLFTLAWAECVHLKHATGAV